MGNKRDVTCWSLIYKNCRTFICLGKDWKAEVIIQPFADSLLFVVQHSPTLPQGQYVPRIKNIALILSFPTPFFSSHNMLA